MTTMPIADRLKEIRVQKGLTQGQLAEMAGIELAQVSRIERGKSEPKLETIQKLMYSLDCSADALINERPVQSTDDWLRKALESAACLSARKKAILIQVIEQFVAAEKLHQAMDEIRPISAEEKKRRATEARIRDEELEYLTRVEEGVYDDLITPSQTNK